MKDIDFDELDRAVSSVLKGRTPSTGTSEPVSPATPQAAAVPAAAPTAASTSVFDIQPPTPVEPVPQVATEPSATTAEPETEPVVAALPKLSPASPSSPAARRSGRFMDMVHPSSDMASAASVAVPSRRTQIAPLSADVVAPSTIVRDIQPPSTITAPVVSSPVVPSPQVTVALTEPTRSETAGVVEEPAAQPTLQPANEPQTSESWPDPLDMPTSPTPETAAPVSPFLSDTKVDKRPLGAFAEDASPDGNDETVSSTTGAALAELATTATTTLPPELDAELVAVDAKEVSQIDDEKLAATFAPEPPVAEPAVSDPMPAAGASIPPQYTAVEPAADHETHPIFDTNSYHQPLLPPKTGKKHTVLWVVIILLLIIVGVGLGVAWFMIGL